MGNISHCAKTNSCEIECFRVAKKQKSVKRAQELPQSGSYLDENWVPNLKIDEAKKLTNQPNLDQQLISKWEQFEITPSCEEKQASSENSTNKSKIKRSKTIEILLFDLEVTDPEPLNLLKQKKSRSLTA